MNYVSDGDSCAIAHIQGLSYGGSGNSARANMLDFVKKLVKPGKLSYGPKLNQTATFVLFNGAVDGYHSNDYATNFADFIEAEKLGSVFRSPKQGNKCYGRAHNNQVFVWCPDDVALDAWYTKNILEPEQALKASK